jgi:hypothetical protein
VDAKEPLQLRDDLAGQQVLDGVGVAVHMVRAELPFVHQEHLPEPVIADDFIGGRHARAGQAVALALGRDQPLADEVLKRADESAARDVRLGATVGGEVVQAEGRAPGVRALRQLVERTQGVLPADLQPGRPRLPPWLPA